MVLYVQNHPAEPSSLCAMSCGLNSRITSRRFETTWDVVKKPLTRVIKLVERSPRQNREVPRGSVVFLAQ